MQTLFIKSSGKRMRCAQEPPISHIDQTWKISLQQFPLMTEKLETIEPYIRPPWWVSRIKFRVETTKDQAKEQHNRMQGNERADAEAKQAATDPQHSKPFNHPSLKSARIQRIKTIAKQWQKEWAGNKTAAH